MSGDHSHMPSGWFGKSVPRKEDAPLVTGAGRYVADIQLPGAVEVTFVRSPVAHARIRSIDVSAARREQGVVAIFTPADIEKEVAPFTKFVDQEQIPPELEAAVHPEILPCDMEVIPGDTVRYVGQAIVAVVATTRYLAEDAAELVDIEYEELPVVTNPEAAIEPDAPLLHEGIPNNVQARFHVDVGNAEAILDSAEHTQTLRFRTQRLSASPMETRGVLAFYDDVSDQITVWSSTQVPYMVRTRIADQLGLSEHQVRVIAPDVGGGFGPKVQVYPEEVLIAHLARVLKRPVKWIEDRPEHLVSTAHSRDQVHFVDVAFEADGTITAIRDRFLQDCGAYNPFSITQSYNTAAHFRSLYKVPHFSVTGECVLTNKTPNVPYRGAGRPEAVFAMDRIIYEVARYLDLYPVEVIRRNLITADKMPHPRGMPYRDGQEIVYDCGDFPAAFEQLLDLVDYSEHKQDQEQLRESGIWRGIGFGTYIEGTGIGPFESAMVQIDSQGRLVIAAGSTSQGQSHATTISQIVADEFGMRPEDIVFREGDTSLIPYGVGTFASRSAVTAGSAVATSSRRLKERIKTMAGDMLEASPSDLDVKDGYIFVRGSESHRVSFHDIFVAASPGSAHYYSANPKFKAPAGMDPGTAQTDYFVPPTVTFGYGLVAAVVEVDVETGFVDLQKVAIIHDCGRIINPLVVEGQIQGGVAQGIGAALYEDFVYDDQGQPLTTTFADYMLPTSAEIPEIVQVHLETPSERNPLGVKGVGEAGIIAPPAAIANAVADALAPMRIQISDLPLSPNAIMDAIDRARVSRNAQGSPNRREESTTMKT